jgi:hypothetical protein
VNILFLPKYFRLWRISFGELPLCTLSNVSPTADRHSSFSLAAHLLRRAAAQNFASGGTGQWRAAGF